MLSHRQQNYLKMANREQLAEMKRAKAGDVEAQISLAKRYLSGEPGLARSYTTALLWLQRASKHGSLDACMLIGSHITVEEALHTASPHSLLDCYKRAYLAGIDAAGLTFAELVVMQADKRPDLREDARAILEKLASKNVAKAQWLLVTGFRTDQLHEHRRHQALNTSENRPTFLDSSSEATNKLVEWTTGAAVGGIPEARLLLAESAWANNDYEAFLQWTLPEAELISRQYQLKRGCAAPSPTTTHRLTGYQTELLYRCVVSLCKEDEKESDKAVRYLELAASEGNALAQLSFGLWLAKMDSEACVIPLHPKRANFERANEWLTSAGSQGMATAWYALSKVYLKAEFAGRNKVRAEDFLKCAAKLDHCDAQLELGTRAWRMRHKSLESDLDAAFWLQKAAYQGCKEAEGMLEQVAPRARASAWAVEMLSLFTPQSRKADPFLAARIELAALVGLSKLEAIWLDIHEADHEHCLVVDVAKHARNTKRRLISLSRDEERDAINRMKALFYGIECNEDGPEGDYRRRMYRLNKLL